MSEVLDFYTGELIDKDTAVTLYRPHSWQAPEIAGYTSQASADNNAYKCKDCGKYFVNEISRVLEHGDFKFICSQCLVDTDYVCCDSCGVYFKDADGHTDEFGRCICNDCYVDYDYATCDECGRIIENGEQYWDHDNCYCFECNRIRHPRLIHDWGYKPMARFQFKPGEEANKLFLGVELEIDNGNSAEACSKELHELDPEEQLFYLKHDGSLGSEGIEIVTHPATLDYHTTTFPWDQIIATAIDNGYRSHDTSTCGLHVHVSKAAFGSTVSERELNIAKVLLIVDRFWDQMIVFSRRRNMNWVNMYAKKLSNPVFYSDDEIEEMRNKMLQWREAGDHHTVVNLLNADTVEFRIFQGTLKKDTLLATLQFLVNIVNYVSNTSLVDVQNADWLNIVHFAHYPELDSYLEAKGLNVSVQARKIMCLRMRKLCALVNEIPFVDGKINPSAFYEEKERCKIKSSDNSLIIAKLVNNVPVNLYWKVTDILTNEDYVSFWSENGYVVAKNNDLAVVDMSNCEALKTPGEVRRQGKTCIVEGDYLRNVDYVPVSRYGGFLVRNTSEKTYYYTYMHTVKPTFPVVVFDEFTNKKEIMYMSCYGDLFRERDYHTVTNTDRLRILNEKADDVREDEK